MTVLEPALTLCNIRFNHAIIYTVIGKHPHVVEPLSFMGYIVLRTIVAKIVFEIQPGCET